MIGRFFKKFGKLAFRRFNRNPSLYLNRNIVSYQRRKNENFNLQFNIKDYQILLKRFYTTEKGDDHPWNKLSGKEGGGGGNEDPDPEKNKFLQLLLGLLIVFLGMFYWYYMQYGLVPPNWEELMKKAKESFSFGSDKKKEEEKKEEKEEDIGEKKEEMEKKTEEKPVKSEKKQRYKVPVDLIESQKKFCLKLLEFGCQFGEIEAKNIQSFQNELDKFKKKSFFDSISEKEKEEIVKLFNRISKYGKKIQNNINELNVDVNNELQIVVDELSELQRRISNFAEFKQNQKRTFLKDVEQKFKEKKEVILSEFGDITKKDWRIDEMKRAYKNKYFKKRIEDILGKIEVHYGVTFLRLLKDNVSFLDTSSMDFCHLHLKDHSVTPIGFLHRNLFDSGVSLTIGGVSFGIVFGGSFAAQTFFDELKEREEIANSIVIPRDQVIKVGAILGGAVCGAVFLYRKWHSNYYLDTHIVNEVKKWFSSENISIKRYKTAFEKMFDGKYDESYDEGLKKEKKLRKQKDELVFNSKKCKRDAKDVEYLVKIFDDQNSKIKSVYEK